jgi:hypothetical protein
MSSSSSKTPTPLEILNVFFGSRISKYKIASGLSDEYKFNTTVYNIVFNERPAYIEQQLSYLTKEQRSLLDKLTTKSATFNQYIEKAKIKHNILHQTNPSLTQVTTQPNKPTPVVSQHVFKPVPNCQKSCKSPRPPSTPRPPLARPTLRPLSRQLPEPERQELSEPSPIVPEPAVYAYEQLADAEFSVAIVTYYYLGMSCYEDFEKALDNNKVLIEFAINTCKTNPATSHLIEYTGSPGNTGNLPATEVIRLTTTFFEFLANKNRCLLQEIINEYVLDQIPRLSSFLPSTIDIGHYERQLCKEMHYNATRTTSNIQLGDPTTAAKVKNNAAALKQKYIYSTLEGNINQLALEPTNPLLLETIIENILNFRIISLKSLHQALQSFTETASVHQQTILSNIKKLLLHIKSIYDAANGARKDHAQLTTDNPLKDPDNPDSCLTSANIEITPDSFVCYVNTQQKNLFTIQKQVGKLDGTFDYVLERNSTDYFIYYIEPEDGLYNVLQSRRSLILRDGMELIFVNTKTQNLREFRSYPRYRFIAARDSCVYMEQYGLICQSEISSLITAVQKMIDTNSSVRSNNKNGQNQKGIRNISPIENPLATSDTEIGRVFRNPLFMETKTSKTSTNSPPPKRVNDEAQQYITVIKKQLQGNLSLWKLENKDGTFSKSRLVDDSVLQVYKTFLVEESLTVAYNTTYNSTQSTSRENLPYFNYAAHFRFYGTDIVFTISSTGSLLINVFNSIDHYIRQKNDQILTPRILSLTSIDSGTSPSKQIELTPQTGGDIISQNLLKLVKFHIRYAPEKYTSISHIVTVQTNESYILYILFKLSAYIKYIVPTTYTETMSNPVLARPLALLDIGDLYDECYEALSSSYCNIQNASNKISQLINKISLLPSNARPEMQGSFNENDYLNNHKVRLVHAISKKNNGELNSLSAQLISLCPPDSVDPPANSLNASLNNSKKELEDRIKANLNGVVMEITGSERGGKQFIISFMHEIAQQETKNIIYFMGVPPKTYINTIDGAIEYIHESSLPPPAPQSNGGMINKNKALVLGRWRNIIVQQKCKYVKVHGELMKLKDAIKAEKKQQSNLKHSGNSSQKHTTKPTISPKTTLSKTISQATTKGTTEPTPKHNKVAKTKVTVDISSQPKSKVSSRNKKNTRK